MFTAMMLHHWVRLGRQLELANFYNLVNVMGILLAKGPRFEITPPADVFKLYRPAFGGEVQAIELEGPTIAGGKSPALDAICLKGDGGAYVLVINRDAEQSVPLALPAELGRAADCTLMVGREPLDEKMPTTTLPAGATITLPPLSIARVKMV